jgi:hypothetical protein
MNPFLDLKGIKEAFRDAHLEENHNFLEEDLQKLADAFIMAAAPAIVKLEREMCIKFVRSLNSHVADKLQEVRGKL